MKSLLSPALAALRRMHPTLGWGDANGGYFRLNNLHIIASNGEGWDHVSVSLPDRCPSWNEMCRVKDLFFFDEECVMQLHPAKSAYVNNHPYTLHLWKPQNAVIPTPDVILV